MKEKDRIMVTKQAEEVAIIIFAYEGFEDIWPIFFNRIKKYWSDVPFKVYFASSKPIETDFDFIFLKVDKEKTWTERLCSALNEIESKYVLLLLEDWLITKNVDSTKIEDVTNFIEKNKILYYKFFLPSFSSNYEKNFSIDSNRYHIDENRRYGISIQPSIWNKEYLISLLENLKIDAWQFEKELDNMNLIDEKSRKKYIFDKRNLLNLTHALRKGKYTRSVYKKIKKEDNEYLSRKQMGIAETVILKIKQIIRQLFPQVLRKGRKNYDNEK